VTVTQTAPPLPATVQVLRMWHGSLVERMLRVAAEHDIWTLLRNGPRTTAELATATRTHEDSLGRLLRALAGLGLLSSDARGWALTPLGDAAGDLGVPLPWFEPVIAALGSTIETGRPAMVTVHGCTAFEYLAQHPDDAAEFDALMTVINAGEPEAVAEAYDFAAARRVVDVGGGNGTLLAEVLRRSPKLEGVLFDVPETAARAVPELGALADRCEIVAGDFFQTVPAGADAYLLSHVLHDWGAPQALAILARVREAIAHDGRLVVVENVMPSDDSPHPARMIDMTMLMITDGGRERTEDEYADLLARARFRLERVILTRAAVSVLEAVPV